MKLHQVPNVVERSGTSGEQAFTIKATSKAFAILSSGLYSDKIGAIVRELSCNAYDAHVAAGTQSTPIQIQLPTSLSPQFQVKDFGIGLDDAGIMNLYTTYFESTKADSNDFIGALGLGSKSPFSYTDSFLVESRHNGVKRLYTAFISESGVPAITRMASCETDEPNGLTITIAVKREDINTFVNAAKRQLMYFSPMPTIAGQANFTAHEVKYTVEGTNWKVRDASTNSAQFSGPRVVQGFVSYPIDTEQLKKYDVNGKLKHFSQLHLDLYVKMGQVEVAASREALSYDKRTALNLVEVLCEAAEAMAVTVQKDFDACPSKWEATKLFNKIWREGDYEFRNMFQGMHRHKPFTYKGVEIGAEMKIDTTGIKSTIFRYVEPNNGTNKISTNAMWSPDKSTKKSVEFQPSSDTIVVVDDLWHGATDILVRYFASKKGHVRHAVFLRPTKKAEFSQAEIDNILARMGCTDYMLLSTLGFTVNRKVSTYVKREKDMRLAWKDFPEKANGSTRRVFSRLCWNSVLVDLSVGGFYVPLERFTILDNKTAVENFDIVLRRALDLKLITKADSERTFGFTEKEIASAPINWKNLFDYIREQYALKNANDAILNVDVIRDVKNSIGSGVTNYLFNNWSVLRQRVNDGVFKNTVDKIIALYPNPDKLEAQNVSHFYLQFNEAEGERSKQKSHDVYVDWKNMTNNYEMLALVNWNSLNGDQLPMLINYINLIDQKKV